MKSLHAFDPGANSVIDSEDGTKIDHTSFDIFITLIIEGRRRHDDADRCILQIQQSKRNGGLCRFGCGSFCINCTITGAVDRSNFLGHA